MVTGRHGPRVQTTAACPRALSHSAVKVLAAQAANGTPSAYSARRQPDWGLGNGTLVWLHCGLFGGGPLDGSRLARPAHCSAAGQLLAPVWSWQAARLRRIWSQRDLGGYFESSTSGLAGDHVRGGRGGRGLGPWLVKGSRSSSANRLHVRHGTLCRQGHRCRFVLDRWNVREKGFDILLICRLSALSHEPAGRLVTVAPMSLRAGLLQPGGVSTTESMAPRAG